jgi:hypothetical protein
MLLALATSMLLALPQGGTVVPGRSLGGVRLGDTRAAVVSRWGADFGVCRNCRDTTLYFTYNRFAPQGAGVTFRNGRVVAAFTLWAPTGWRTTKGLHVQDNAARITELYGALPRTICAGYDAFELREPGTRTAIYVRLGSVWGFGVMRRSEPLCR